MTEKPDNSLMKFLLRRLVVLIIVMGVVIGITYLMGMAMFNWNG